MDIERLNRLFGQKFGGQPTAAFAAPGRINLIGEHTDYNGGYVFPGAVQYCIGAVLRPSGSRRVRLYAADLDMECTFDLDGGESPDSVHMRYVYGVVCEMMARGVEVDGFDAVYGGDVPIAAGMSSSAALECCFAMALNEMYGGTLSPMELARVGQATEHNYVGVKCGIMDQFIAMHGRAGHLVRLDCRSGEFEYYPWKPEGYRLVLVNSCVKHELVGSPYNERRESCERVARAAGCATLRECSPAQLEALRPQLDETDYRRARFVLGEEERVLAVCDALKRDDYEEVGKQMYQTHGGLSRDYEVSCVELDFLVQEAWLCGVTGSRLMGGGFGGCTINLVREERYEAFIAAVQRRYHDQFGRDCKIIPVEIGDGARQII